MNTCCRVQPDRLAIPRLKRAPAKRAIRRTRTGCGACKRRKIKCDEATPSCRQCLRRHLDCDLASGRISSPLRLSDTPSILSSSSDRSATLAVPIAPANLHLSTPWDALFHASPTFQSTPTHSILGESVRESFLPLFFEQILGQVFHTVIDGPSNPFVTALLPLVQTSATVLSAIQALTGLHIGSKSGSSRLIADGLKHQGDAIRQLASDLSDPGVVDSDAALASSLILCICEQAWGNRNLVSIQYLEGARSLIRRRFLDRPQSSQNIVTASTKLFIKQVVWHDVLSNFTRPYDDIAATSSLNLLRLTDVLNDKGDANPFLFGYARDIFWLMIEVASFSREIWGSRLAHKSDKVLRIDTLQNAIRLEERLQTYEIDDSGICLYHGDGPISATDLRDCRTTVEVYRRTALIYLYQVMPELVQQHATENLARSILALMTSVSQNSRTIAFHVWCLVIIGSGHKCAADDRRLVLDHLKRIQQQFPLSLYANNAEALVLEVQRKTNKISSSGRDIKDCQLHWAEAMLDLRWGIGYL